MSGAKRRTKYRKHVTQEFADSEREPVDNEAYAQVVQSHGSNIFEVLLGNGENTLARLPTKFQKLIWMKRGDFVIVSSASEEYSTATGATGRVTHSIEHILNGEQLKKLKRELVAEKNTVFVLAKTAQPAASLPETGSEAAMAKDRKVSPAAEGTAAEGLDEGEEGEYFEESEGDDSDLFVNRNKRVETSDDESSEDDDA